ncbi:hypothetical protein ABC255_09590 [Neobacillus sp. 3P2-tot-E-2]
MIIKTNITHICSTEDEEVLWIRLGNDGRLITVNKEESEEEQP